MPTYDVTYNEPLLIVEIEAANADEAREIVVSELEQAAQRARRDPEVFIAVRSVDDE